MVGYEASVRIKDVQAPFLYLVQALQGTSHLSTHIRQCSLPSCVAWKASDKELPHPMALFGHTPIQVKFENTAV